MDGRTDRWMDGQKNVRYAQVDGIFRYGTTWPRRMLTAQPPRATIAGGPGVRQSPFWPPRTEPPTLAGGGRMGRRCASAPLRPASAGEASQLRDPMLSLRSRGTSKMRKLADHMKAGWSQAMRANVHTYTSSRVVCECTGSLGKMLALLS